VQVLREREKAVIGLGLKQTAQAFVNAFSEFIYLDSDPLKDRQAPEKQNNKHALDLSEDRLTALKEVIDKLIEEDGWALFARIATEMKNKFSDFVPRNYNCRSLKEFMIKVKPLLGSYEIQTDSDGTTMFLIPAPVCECKSDKKAVLTLDGDGMREAVLKRTAAKKEWVESQKDSKSKVASKKTVKKTNSKRKYNKKTITKKQNSTNE
jgi:hypothetical protein